MEEIPAKRINFLGCFIFPSASSPEMSGVLRVVRSSKSGSSPQAGLGAAETRRGFREVGVGLSAASAAGTAAAGSRAEKGRTPEVLGEALCQGHSPDPKPSPGRLAQQGAAPAPPGSPRRGGTFPTGSDPVQSRGTGAPQPVCQGNPSGCVRWGGGVGGEKKKRWVRLESQRPPPPDGPRPFSLCEPQRRGGGETKEPADGHGLGVTEPPGRPGG